MVEIYDFNSNSFIKLSSRGIFLLADKPMLRKAAGILINAFEQPAASSTLTTTTTTRRLER